MNFCTDKGTVGHGQCTHQLINSSLPSDAIQDKDWLNIGTGNGLLPDGTKPLPEPMLTFI